MRSPLRHVLVANPRTRAAVAIITLLFVVLRRGWLNAITSTDLQASQHTTNSGIDAIVTIAAKGFGSAMVVSSLRQVGLWDGPIYVLTNNLAKHKEVATRFNVTLINFGGNHPTFLAKQEWQDYKDYLDNVNRDFWVKWHKTQIFNLVSPDVQTVLYMDADIVLQRPIHNFLHDTESLVVDTQCEVCMYPERWYTGIPCLTRYADTGKYNSGIMVLKRNESRALLQEWNTTLVKSPFGKRDQPKLTLALKKLQTKVCSLPKHHVLFEADGMDRMLNQWLHVRHATFRHWTSRKSIKQTWNTTR